MQIIQKYVKGVQRFDSVRVFVKHAYELYDAMIVFLQIVHTFHINTQKETDRQTDKQRERYKEGHTEIERQPYRQMTSDKK